MPFKIPSLWEGEGKSDIPMKREISDIVSTTLQAISKGLVEARTFLNGLFYFVHLVPSLLQKLFKTIFKNIRVLECTQYGLRLPLLTNHKVTLSQFNQ